MADLIPLTGLSILPVAPAVCSSISIKKMIDFLRRGRCLVPVRYSCKGRAFCPSCGGRRLVDSVFPDVPVRQCVMSLPFALRYRLAYDASAVSAVLRIFVRAIFEALRRRARDNVIHNAQCGAVTFIQRFGSALNPNVHFHVVVLDGVYACTEEEEQPRFYPLCSPEKADVLKVATRVAMRTAALIEGPEQSDLLERELPGMSALYGASLCGRIAMGPNAGKRVKTRDSVQMS